MPDATDPTGASRATTPITAETRAFDADVWLARFLGVLALLATASAIGGMIVIARGMDTFPDFLAAAVWLGAGVLWFGHRLARAGRTIPAAWVGVSVAILVPFTAGLVAPSQNVLALTPIIAIGIGLPYLPDRQIRILVVLAWVGGTATAIVQQIGLADGSDLEKGFVAAVSSAVLAIAIRLLIAYRTRILEALADRRALSERVPIGLFRVDLTGRVQDGNRALARILGYDTIDELVAEGVIPFAFDPGEREMAADEMARTGMTRDGHVRVVRRDGTWIPIRFTVQPVIDPSGQFVAFEGAIEDLSALDASERERERLEHELNERAAVSAALRSLRPRGSVQTTADMIGSQVLRVAELGYACIALFGPAGTLEIVAFRTRDGIAPVGGEIPGARAAHLRERAAEGPWVAGWTPVEGLPYGSLIDGLGVRSIVYAPILTEGALVGLLICGTELETHAASERLPALVEFAAIAGALLGGELAGHNERSSVRANIRAIIEQKAFTPVFQPIVELESGAVVGYEALTRFADGVPPDHHFIEASAAGLGLELEMATLEAALVASTAMSASAFLELNVSPALVLHEDRLGKILERWGWQTVIELTEHAPVEDYGSLREAIERLGPTVRLAIDDTGAGYSSLRHLVELRPHFVKLDRALVGGIHADAARQAMLAGLVHFATATGCTLVAEGVELKAESTTLQELGVRFGQGYLFAHPKPVEAFIRQIA